MRVVCITAECEPWAKTGGLGDVVDALARAVSALGTRPPDVNRVVAQQVWVGTGAVMGPPPEGLEGLIDRPVEVFLPRYRGSPVPAGATSTPLDVPDPTAPGGATRVNLVEFDADGYRVRMIDHPRAFDREGFYGDDDGDYPDNGWRFGLLCRGALEALLADDRPLDVIHLRLAGCPSPSRDQMYAAYPKTTARRSCSPSTTWPTRAGCRGSDADFAPDEISHPSAPRRRRPAARGIKRAELVNTVSPLRGRG
jgi:hypothetical protein